MTGCIIMIIIYIPYFIPRILLKVLIDFSLLSGSTAMSRPAGWWFFPHEI
jgi:hypothetical protein